MKSDKSRDSFVTLIESNKGLIYKVANSYCKDEENRKDLIQEISVQLWKSMDKFNNEYKLSTWIYRIALNVAISFYRKENRRKEINYPISEEIFVMEEDLNETQNENINLLQKFIRELKEIDRAIILLYLEKTPQREISEIMGLSESNISTKISRIKKQLKQKFEKVEVD